MQSTTEKQEAPVVGHGAISISAVLVDDKELAGNGMDATRFLNQGSVRVNGTVVHDPEFTLVPGLHEICIGKRRQKTVRVSVELDGGAS